MGVVYRARDERLLRDVALKVLPPELTHAPARKKRLLREAQAAARVQHPCVAAIFEVSVEQHEAFIAMELAEGPTLRAVLHARRLAAGEAVRLATFIADGLAAAHAQGIVHRDLKPENVIVTGAGMVKILDFGLARMNAGELSEASLRPAGEHLTREGQVIGTPAYMSPEQARGEAVDARSDVFSFGAVFYEMLTGRVLFAEAARAEAADRAVSATDLAELAPSSASVVRRCLEPDPRARYADAGALAADLQAIAGEASTERKNLGPHATPS